MENADGCLGLVIRYVVRTGWRIFWIVVILLALYGLAVLLGGH